ncbi:carboxymuconolactone decarboxylase family protein [uncultured Bacteroides sp.]|uniref:cupin domain-containing carboxymuconolactone decarboxylase family protein n=1 Tax=uncultured Bacteroides sp. TaxID=162156 RepID=UPI002AAB22E7|nr:carboxymuconolactone decarboxylase family protein [uncultured Bacteroides sp.]
MVSFKEKGVAAPSSYFTGRVWVNMNINPEDGYNTMVGTVNFEAKSRTNWHSHTSGQILFVISGVGYYQEKGKSVQIIREGDVVKIPKNVVHWHGASHNCAMTHIAMVPELDKDKTEWLNPVSDKEYNKCSTQNEDININLTEKAIKNHEELWPGYESKAKQTDPELIEIFDNFAFDEVIKYGNLDTKTRVMMIMGSTIAQGALTEYKMFVNGALNVGVTPVEIKEILYQSVAYVGVAKVIDFIYAANEILKERGIELPVKGQSTTTPETRMEKGLALQKDIFGDMIDKMYEQSPKNQLHIQKYLSANCFGDYQTRTGLDAKTRELLTFSMLISMGGTESQVKGHILGNVKVGNDKETLLSVATQLLPYIGYPRTLNALKCLNEVIPE